MPRLIFYTDFERDLEIYKKWNMRKFFGDETFNYFLSLYYPELASKSDKEIFEYFKNNKEIIIMQTENTGKRLKHKFEKTGKDFFKQVGDVTGFKWKHRVYYCHLSSTFICGGCYDAEKGNIVSVFPGLKHASPLDVMFHELIHLHFWDAVDDMKIKYNKKERIKTKGILWDLSEIAVNYPLQKIKLFGYASEFHIHSQQKELWKRIKKYWHMDFRNFVFSSLKEMKYPL